MKILWLDINSSYSHSSMALPAIHAQVSGVDKCEWLVVRGTINDNPGSLAAAVAEHKPDIIAATFWLFNRNMQIEVLSRSVQMVDNVKVICGGPEFLCNNEDFLRQYPFVTAVFRGEGEVSVPEFLKNINVTSAWRHVEGLCWIEDGIYHDNGTARVADFPSLKYPEESPFFNWDKPFVQLETSRGCFNTCAFCVSGNDRPVRYQSLDQVSDRLQIMHSHGIKDVRVLDRTFNHDIDRAIGLLTVFEKYAGKMRFHLEIHPSLLPVSLRDKIASLPEGLLHLEAGIQSLDSGVLSECGRKGSIHTALEGLRFLCSLSNVQTHADLIAGLPSYSLKMLCHDATELIKMGVDELQIESLKVLPGTELRRLAYSKNLAYSPLPPYEVLQTPDMSAKDLLYAMKISRTVDLYYNCPAWQQTVRSLIIHDTDFLARFAAYLDEMMVLDSPVSVERRGVLLYEYCRKSHPEKLPDVSVAWIEAGLSLKKEPAGHITRIKNIGAYIAENGLVAEVRYGLMLPSHRYYLLAADTGDFVFGYDSETHRPSPAMMAILSKNISNLR